MYSKTSSELSFQFYLLFFAKDRVIANEILSKLLKRTSVLQKSLLNII